jgi:hypothetical protein
MPKKPKLTDEQIEKIAIALRSLDFKWWHRRNKLASARKHLEDFIGLPVSARLFKQLRDAHCVWYTKARRPGPSLKLSLDEEGWQELRKRVAENKSLLSGRSLDEAVAIMCTIIPCNRRLLQGLRKDLHYWTD